MTKIVLFIFAGRQENMRVQKPYLDRLLEEWPELEVHLWDLTRNASDAAYLRSRDTEFNGRVKVMDQFHSGHPIQCRYPRNRPKPRGYPPCQCMRHKPPYEKPYKWYAKHGTPDTIYIKVDDDVLFLETKRLGDLLDPLVEMPDRVMSANVVNNAVCAKYDAELTSIFRWVGDPRNPADDLKWWALHIEPLFARMCHEWFLNCWDSDTPQRPFRTRLGEAISINCIAFTQQTMTALAEDFTMNSRLGDEGAVDARLPWIVPTFRAAHLTFGPQEAAMPAAELDSLRERYSQIAKEYLP